MTRRGLLSAYDLYGVGVVDRVSCGDFVFQVEKLSLGQFMFLTDRVVLGQVIV